MILRKPYAFLIKHFRLIHIILTIIMIFTLKEINGLNTFFSDYLKNSSNLRLYIEPSITSVKWYIYLLVLFVIGILSVIFILMNKKKKPVKFYLISIIFYSLLIIDLIFTNSQIFSLIQNEGDLKIINLTNDLLGIFSFLEYIFILISLLRGIGFNIKKFDFKNDLREINIGEEDSEEFELDVAVDSNDIKTKFKRFFRILKYIIQENKVLVFIVGSFLGFYLIISGILNVFVYNRMYRENQMFKSGDFKIKVLDSYYSTKDYKLNDISSNNKYIYYIVKVEIQNQLNTEKVLNVSNARLKVSKYQSYDINSKSYSYFSDIGTGYYKQKLEPKKQYQYIFVFKVDKEYENEDKTFEVFKNITSKDGELKYNYTKVKIKPDNLDEYEQKSNASLNQTLKIESNLIGKVNIKIENIEILDKVEYKYKQKIGDKEYNFIELIQPSIDDYYGKKILKLKAKIETSNSNDIINNNFIGNFGHIRYIKNGKEYKNIFDIKERTPSGEEEYKFIEVTDDIKDCDNIWLDLIIRNNLYTYKIK